MPPEDLLFAGPSREDILGPDRQPESEPVAETLLGLGSGLGRSTMGRASALATALGNEEAAANLKPAAPNTLPGSRVVNPESPYFKGGEAGGALIPDMAFMAAAPEAAVPALVADSLLRGPQEAAEKNAYIRQLKEQFPNDPKIQALHEGDPALHGLTEAAKMALFPQVAKGVSASGIKPLTEFMADQTGPIGTAGRALTSRPGSFLANTAANTVGNLAVGDVLERASDPNFQPPQTPTDAALAMIPAGAFGAMGAMHELPPARGTDKYGKVNQPPPLPPLAEAAPALSLAPQTQAAAQTAEKIAKAKVVPPTPPPIPEPVVATAAPTPAPAVENPAAVLFPKAEPKPPEPTAARIGFLHDELEKTNPAELERIQTLAGRRDWSETEFLDALEKAVSDARLAETKPPPLPQQDEKGTSQESNVGGQAEQQGAPKPDAVDQLRGEPGSAVATEGTGDQLRGQHLDGPGAEGQPVQGQREDRGLGSVADAESEKRGNGEQRPSGQEQSVLVPAPETPATLQAQQEQLVNGQRPAMLFTPGEKPLKLPKGMKAVMDKNGGTWHYDPKKTTALKIKSAVQAGTENELLNLGPKSKAEVLSQTGKPVGVVERDPKGVEVRAAVTTPEDAAGTAAVMEPQKTPGNTISVEHPAAVIAGRGVNPEDLLAPRPGSLGTKEGLAKVNTEDKPSGKKPKKTVEEHEEDLNELNPSALADVQRERAVNSWSDREYERALKGRVYKEQKSQGVLPEAKPVEQLPTKAKAVEETKAEKKGPKKQTDEEKEASIKETIKDLQARAKAADKKGDQQAAAEHLKEAAEWQEVIDANEREKQKEKVALKANEGDVGEVPEDPMQHADAVEGEVNGFRSQFPEAPPMVTVHSENLPHVLDPETFAMFQKMDEENGGKTRSFADPNTGKVYILHDRVGGLAPIERRMIYHEETFGHLGLEEAMRHGKSAEEYGSLLDDAFNHLVADQGPQANLFTELVRAYKGRGVDPHDVVNHDETRRFIMSEVLAHSAGKAVDKPWVTQAIVGLKRLLGKITGIDLTHRDDYFQRLVDAGMKHLRERMSEGADARDYSPPERQELRANMREKRKTAEEADKALPFKRPPTSSINENEKFPTPRPEDWVADAILGAARTKGSSPAEPLPDGDVDPQAYNREINAAYRRAKSLGRDIDYTELTKRLQFDAAGGEHETAYDPSTDRYFKLTQPGFAGLKPFVYKSGALHLAKATPADYAQRWKDWNQATGDDVRVHGLTQDDKGNIRIVTSQPAIDEIPAPLDPAEHLDWEDRMKGRIDDYFKRHGFVKISVEGVNGPTYVNPDEHLLFADTKPGNIVEVATPKGSRLKFIDAAMARGKDDPAVKRAIEMAQEVKDGRRDPELPATALEDQPTARQNIAPVTASQVKAAAFRGLPSDVRGELMGKPTPKTKDYLTPAERLRRRGVGPKAGVDELMEEGGLNSDAPVTPTEAGRMQDMSEKDFLESLTPLRFNVGPKEEAGVDKDNQLKYSSLDERLLSATPQAGLQSGARPQPAQSAEDYVRGRDAARVKDNRGVVGTFADRYRDQARDLISWARDSGRVLEQNSPLMERLNRLGLGGGEHDVLFDPETHRWIKVTQPGQMGIKLTGLVRKPGVSPLETGNKLDSIVTPLDYLDRIKILNELGDDIQIHGITFQEGSSQPSFVTSQPHYDGVSPTDSPTVNKILIDKGMAKAGFVKIGDGEFYNPQTRVTMADVHPRNVAINKDGSIIPFDAVSSRGDFNVEENSRAALQRVRSGQVSFKTDPIRDFFDRGRPKPLATAEPQELRANLAPENKRARNERIADEIVNADSWDDIRVRAKKYGVPLRGFQRETEKFFKASQRAEERGVEPPDEQRAMENIRAAAEDDVNRWLKTNPSLPPGVHREQEDQRYNLMKPPERQDDLRNIRFNVGPTTVKDIIKQKAEDLVRIHRRFDSDVHAIKAALPRGLDARDNEAANSGLRAENDVAAFVAENGGARQKNSKEAIAQRESILPLVEAGFGKVTDDEEYGEAVDKLRKFKERVDAALQSQDPKVVAAAKRLEKPTNDALQIALTDSEKAMGWAGKVRQEFDAQHSARVAEGLNPKYFDNYAKRILEADPSEDTAYAIPGGGGTAGFDRAQNMTRRFETAFDAMEQGKRLAEMDVAGLVGKGQVDTMKALGNEDLFDSFRNMVVPGSNRKVIADARKVYNPLLNGGKGGLETKAPKGPYTLVEGPRGERLFVDKEFAHYFKNLLGTSYVANNAALSGLLRTAATLKHGVLLFDTFHVGRVMARLANLLAQARYGKGLANLDIPLEVLQKLGITQNAKYGKGRALLDFKADTLDAAERLGWVNAGDAKWARENQALLPLMEKTGFNVAGNLDNLYERSGAHGLVHQVLEVLGKGDVNVGKGIETFNKWVFQKLTRNAMAIGWKEAFERNQKRFSDKTQEEIARITSKEMNEYFGNLGRQGLFKSATAQDLARLTFLAPQWANSMIASQVRGVGQLASLAHPERRPGNVAGAMATGYLAMFAANQIINLITKHQPTWENEEGHKMDAYIPGGKHGFHLNPASIVAEELHTLLRYHEGGTDMVKGAARILMNKASPMMRAQMAINPLIARDSMLRPIKPGAGLPTALRSLSPLPIFSGAATGDLLNPEMSQKGDMQRQLMGMVGLKLDRAQGPGQKLRSMAKETIPEAFPKDESPGDYAPLRAFVNNDHESKAKAEILDLLRKGKTVAELNRVFAHKPIGNSAQRQAMFLQKRPDAVALLQPAAEERAGSAKKLAELIQSIPQDQLQDAITEGTQRLLK